MTSLKMLTDWFVYLQMMVRYNRVECLSHPVCTAFLRMKWIGYGVWIHLINLCFYLIFLASLTAFVTSSHIMPHSVASSSGDDVIVVGDDVISESSVTGGSTVVRDYGDDVTTHADLSTTQTDDSSSRNGFIDVDVST